MDFAFLGMHSILSLFLAATTVSSVVPKDDKASAAYAEPQATYRTYIEAIRKFDVEAAKACWVIDDDNKCGALDTMVGLWIYMRKINQVAEKNFGVKDLDASLKGYRRDDVSDAALDRTKKRLDDVEVKVSGDTATLIIKWKEDDGYPNPTFCYSKDPKYFRKVNGHWKFDANKETGLVRGADFFRKGTWGPMFRDQVVIIKEAIDGIENKKLTSSKEMGGFIDRKIEALRKKYTEERNSQLNR